VDFRRYLLGELLYELKELAVEVPGLTDVSPQAIEVVEHRGYEALVLRTPAGAFEARLDWSLRSPPVVVRTAGEQVR
jgi:hypothetical protein